MGLVSRAGYAAVICGFAAAFELPLPLRLDPTVMSAISLLFHIGAYALLTGYMVCRYRTQMLMCALIVAAFATLLEALQLAVPGRYFGIEDVLANGLGVLAGLGAAWVMTRRRTAMQNVMAAVPVSAV